MSRTLRLFVLVMSALALTMTSAHVLEMPQKMQLSPALYTAVNGTLYRWFAIAGGAYTVIAIASAWALVWSARGRHRAFTWAVAGALLSTLAFLSWALLVQPVNHIVADATATHPERLPMLWSVLRARWEYGHLTGFVLQLLAFLALANAVVSETPGLHRPVHTRISMRIRAPAGRVFELYARWQDWPRIFGATIRGVRLVRQHGNVYEIDVDHVEGHVPNRMSLVSPGLIVLEEQKRRYDAIFENRFEPIPEGTRYVVSADVVLRGRLGLLRWLAKPLIRSRIRRFVLEPIRRAAEEGAVSGHFLKQA